MDGYATYILAKSWCDQRIKNAHRVGNHPQTVGVRLSVQSRSGRQQPYRPVCNLAKESRFIVIGTKKAKYPDLTESRHCFPYSSSYQAVFFFSALVLAHRARCAAAILLRAAVDSVRFRGITTTLLLLSFALALAHRAR
jgi:hypothetical protein